MKLDDDAIVQNTVLYRQTWQIDSPNNLFPCYYRGRNVNQRLIMLLLYYRRYKI